MIWVAFYAGSVVGLILMRLLTHYLGMPLSKPWLFVLVIALLWPVTMPILLWYVRTHITVVPDRDV